MKKGKTFLDKGRKQERDKCNEERKERFRQGKKATTRRVQVESEDYSDNKTYLFDRAWDRSADPSEGWNEEDAWRKEGDAYTQIIRVN